MRLNEAQSRFKEVMLDQPEVVEAPPGDFVALFASSRISLAERLKVYRNNIVGSLTRAMRASFPAIDDLVGEEFFDTMARSFIMLHPPREGNINNYGAGFDAFIRSYKPAHGLPYLADVAKLEIAVNDSYFEKDDAPLTAGILAGIAQEDLKLIPRASVRLVSTDYPARKIRDFCLGGDKSGTLDISGGGENTMVFRPEFDVVTLQMTDEDFAFMKLLRSEPLLSEALEQFLQTRPDFDFQSFLQRHIVLESFAAP